MNTLSDRSSPHIDDFPEIRPITKADPASAFRVVGDTSYLYFVPRSVNLVITFDNLATLDQPYPRRPWLHGEVERIGCSVLGVQSQAKDWFRTAEPPAFLRRLAEDGFFRGFSSVVLTGASMGGFAALNFAPLIEGARVLAFSPQSTMSREIATFEGRFPWAVRNSNWADQPFLDAAAAIPYIPHIALVYDPFVTEDRSHAARMSGPNVQHLRVDHSSHEAIRCILKSNAVGAMLRDMASQGYIGAEVWRLLRGRRNQRKWCRTFLSAAETRHPRLALLAAQAMKDRLGYTFAAHAVERLALQDWASQVKEDQRSV